MTAAAKSKLGYDDLWALGEDTRTELIRGELVPKAAPRLSHSGLELLVGAWLVRRFNRQVSGRWPGGWRILSELHVVYSDQEIYCHDLTGYHRARLLELDEPGWTHVRPNWVCELLSPGHERRDLVDKRETLERVGVEHYWIIDPEEKRLEIYRLEPRGYALVTSVGSGETIRAEPFDSVELRTAVLFADEDDID